MCPSLARISNYSTKDSSPDWLDNSDANLDTVVIDVMRVSQEDDDQLQDILNSKFSPSKQRRKKIKYKSVLDKNEYKNNRIGFSNHEILNDERFLSVLTRPQWPSLPILRITLHISQLGGIKGAFDFLIESFGYYWAFKIINEGIISRLDRCLDIKVSLDEILSLANRQKVKHVLKYIGRKDSYSVGSVKPLQHMIYEKLSLIIDRAINTRLEERVYYQENIKIRHLSQLPLILQQPVFEKLIIFRLNEELWNDHLIGSPRLRSFDYHRKKYGFISSKTKHDINGNFHRINEIWRACTSRIDLSNAFKASLEGQLREVFHDSYYVKHPWDHSLELMDDEFDLSGKINLRPSLPSDAFMDSKGVLPC